MCDVIFVKAWSNGDPEILQTALLSLRATKWGHLPELSRTIEPFPQVPHATHSNGGLVLFWQGPRTWLKALSSWPVTQNRLIMRAGSPEDGGVAGTHSYMPQHWFLASLVLSGSRALSLSQPRSFH